MTKPASKSHGYTTTQRDEPNIPEPTYAERVRTLVHRTHMGTLSTLSAKHPDWPFGSMMPYGLDDKGRPTFLISTMAMHTHNLIRDGKSSLFISQTDSGGDPLDASRVTLMGETTKVPEDELSADSVASCRSRDVNIKTWLIPLMMIVLAAIVLSMRPCFSVGGSEMVRTYGVQKSTAIFVVNPHGGILFITVTGCHSQNQTPRRQLINSGCGFSNVKGLM